MCGIENNKIFFVECLNCDFDSNFDTPEAAIAAWNRRVREGEGETNRSSRADAAKVRRPAE